MPSPVEEAEHHQPVHHLFSSYSSRNSSCRLISEPCSLLNPCMVFGSVGPVFIFHQNKNNMIHYFFKLRLIGLGSFSAKNIYQTKFSSTAHRNPPPLHIYITYRVFGSTGPGLIKVWKLEVLCTFSLSSSCLGLL